MPAKPDAPVTTWVPDDVFIYWTSPDDGGSPITGYRVSMEESDGSTYTIDFVNCDMSSSLETTCMIPVEILKATPYSLEWGSSV